MLFNTNVNPMHTIKPTAQLQVVTIKLKNMMEFTYLFFITTNKNYMNTTNIGIWLKQTTTKVIVHKQKSTVETQIRFARLKYRTNHRKGDRHTNHNSKRKWTTCRWLVIFFVITFIYFSIYLQSALSLSLVVSLCVVVQGATDPAFAAANHIS